jgi:hypothetical protein
MTFRSRSRFARCSAALALILTCALASAATQATSDATPAKKPAAKKATHKKSAAPAGKTSGHTTSAHSATTSKTRAAAGKSSRKKTVRGQQKIDGDRAGQIQQALIREHYLTGEATGSWNTASEDAMRRYQADHGWQTKEVPDSRALIRLDHLLNPESAMTTVPVAPKAASLTTSSHSASTTTDSPAPVSTAPATSTPPASDPAPTPAQNGSVDPQR